MLTKETRNWIAGYITDTASAVPIDGVLVTVWVDWDRQPVSVHGDDQEGLRLSSSISNNSTTSVNVHS